MSLETGTYISDLVPANPAGTDQINEADDHIRLIKSTLKNTFPNVNGAVDATPAQINQLVDNDFDSIITEGGVEVAKLTGATFTGPVYDDGNDPTVDGQLANKGYVDSTIQTAYPPYPDVPIHLYGNVSSAGIIQKGSGGFTISKGATGYYTVNLSPAISEEYVVVVSSAGDSPALTFNSFTETANSFQVSCRYAGGSGEGFDRPWSFILTYYGQN